MNKKDIPAKILCFFAHEDDEIIGSGGLLAKNVSLGGVSKVVCFGGSTHQRKSEFELACSILGVEGKTLNYPEGYLKMGFETLKTVIIKEILDFQPDFIVTHDGTFDYHPDHKTVFDFVFTSTLFAMNKKNAPQVKFILTTETHQLFSEYHVSIDITLQLSKKIQAMNAHVSQLKKSSDYYVSLISKKAELRGLQSGVKYAEAFRKYNLPIIANISGSQRAI